MSLIFKHFGSNRDFGSTREESVEEGLSGQTAEGRPATEENSSCGRGSSAEFQSIPLRMLGFGILMGWHFLILYFPELSAEPMLNASDRYIGQLVLNGSFGASFALFGFALSRNAPWVMRHNFAICIASSAVAVAACLVFAFASPLSQGVLYQASIGVMGACEGLFMLLWFRFYAETEANYTMSCIATSAIVGALICFFARHLTSGLPLVVFAALPVLSMLLLIPSIKSAAYREAVLSGKGKPNWPGAASHYWRSTTQLVVFSLSFGVLQGVATLQSGLHFLVGEPVASLGFGVAGIILFVVYLKSPERMNLTPAHKTSVILFIGGISFVPFVSGAPAVLASGLAMTGFTLFDMVTLVFVLNLVRTFDLDPEIALGGNRSLEYGGFTVGIALGYVILLAFGDVPLLPCILVSSAALICFVTVLLLFVDARSIWDEGGLKELRAVENGALTPSKGRWKAACDCVCKEYELSPRERDVFMLIAKGRNAEYVQNALYISGHTAKTHISNIYKKLDIHSVQDLLDMVEKYKESQN